jgi:hypothetical protein
MVTATAEAAELAGDRAAGEAAAGEAAAGEAAAGEAAASDTIGELGVAPQPVIAVATSSIAAIRALTPARAA